VFSLGETHVLENTFRKSGLRDVTVRALSLSRRFSSKAEMIRRLKETAFLRGPNENWAKPSVNRLGRKLNAN
jgi:hypothetical protein